MARQTRVLRKTKLSQAWRRRQQAGGAREGLNSAEGLAGELGRVPAWLTAIIWRKKAVDSRLRMSPLGRGYGVATILVAATGIADYKLFGFRGQRIRAVMHPLAKAACSGRRRRGRDRYGNQISHEREEQSQFGRQATHGLAGSLPTGEAEGKNNPFRWWGRNPKARSAGKMLGILRLRHARRFAERVSPLRMTGAAVGFQALPWILAHHQRTPTNRKRQSEKNSGGLPSKAWPMNWRIHPRINSPSA